MNVRLHANATTTPKTRRYIQTSHQSVTQLADELGVSEDTIRRWQRRDSVTTPHRLQTHPYPDPGGRGGGKFSNDNMSGPG